MKEEKALKTCTFQPKISEIARNSPSRPGSIYRRNIEWKNRITAEAKEKSLMLMKTIMVDNSNIDKAKFSKRFID